ncbi:hypothetical protein MP228_005946 [Amoeboaphelidium protococcarum]|nr:hypothetical protein MP228_005946 [Amoeboaphelidium protococcarum]
MDANQWLKECIDYIKAENYEQLRKYFKLNKAYPLMTGGSLSANAVQQRCLQLPAHAANIQWRELISTFIQAQQYAQSGQFIEAFNMQRQVVLQLRDFRLQQIPVVMSVLIDLKNLAILADQQQLQQSQQNLTQNDLIGDEKVQESSQKHLEEASRMVMKAFTSCINDRSPLEHSRKWGTYKIMVLLFKCYRKLGTLNLSKNSILAIRNAKLPADEDFDAQDIVQFKFYLASYLFWSEQYALALEEFLFVWKHVSRLQNCPKVQHAVLEQLIPLQLINGSLMLTKPQFLCDNVEELDRLCDEHVALALIVKSGNVPKLKSIFAAGAGSQPVMQVARLSSKSYLVLERAMLVCWRNLLKRVYVANDKSSRMPLDHIAIALSLFEPQFKLSGIEIECVVANLIYKNMVKGYISHEKQILVLSNKEPYPKVKIENVLMQ